MAAKKAPSFNQRLKAARERSGLTLQDVYVELRARLPKQWCASPPTLYRLETDKPEAKVNPMLICALADVYGVPLADLSPMTAEDLPRLRDLLLARSGWTHPATPAAA